MHILLIVFFLFPPLVHGAEWAKGENLLTTFNTDHPLSEGYEILQKIEPTIKSFIWKSKEHGFSDAYAVNIMTHRTRNLTLDGYRSSGEEQSRPTCDEFLTETVDTNQRNGYDSVFWKTVCTQGEAVLTSLQLAISGNDSFYHLLKFWRGAMPDTLLAEWTQLLGSTSLCDTRSINHPCPDGFTKVQ